MELIVMSLGGSLMALCVHLAEFATQTVVAAADTVLVFRRGARLRREATQAGCKTSLAVAATTLIYALSLLTATALLYALTPVRAVASELSVRAARPEQAAASLTENPLVMRLGKDEFRVAFGINSVGCSGSGCYGAIRYRVNWTAEDGTTHSDIREVGYTVVPNAARTITVDRQYFDTSEGAHTTDVVQVTVSRITCHRGTEGGVLSADRADPAGLQRRAYRGADPDHSNVAENAQQP